MSPVVDQLVAARKRLGIKQGEVALRMRANQANLSLLEHGAKEPLLSTLEKWADALGLQIVAVDKPAPSRRRLALEDCSERQRAILNDYVNGAKTEAIAADHGCFPTYAAVLASRVGVRRRSWHGTR